MDAAAIRDVCRELAGEEDPGRIRELFLELRQALAVQQSEALCALASSLRGSMRAPDLRPKKNPPMGDAPRP
jgi:hypothetical protein